MTDIRNVRVLARLLDASIPVPGTTWRVGLDPIIGLVPGIGDMTGILLSGYVLLSAARLDAPRVTLLRMAGNVALEGIVGVVPVVGDLFDAGWKANLRNVRLLEAHLEAPSRSARASRGWLLGVAVALIALLLGAAGLAAWLMVSLLRLLGFG